MCAVQAFSAGTGALERQCARKNDELDALATALAAWRNERLALVDPEAGSEVLRLLSERREDLVALSVPEPSTACTHSCGISCPVG
jgi:hypothetical protein